MWLAQQRKERQRSRLTGVTVDTAKLTVEAWRRLHGFLSRQKPILSAAIGSQKPGRSVLRADDQAFVRSALASLRRMGVPTPVLGQHIGDDEAQYLRDYFGSIHSFLKAGLDAELRQEAERFIAVPLITEADRRLVSEWYAAETSKPVGK